MLFTARLYCILDLGYVTETRAEEITTALLTGGAQILQLRAKGHELPTIRRVAEKLIPLCRAAGVPFVLNDHFGLAKELGADGVHLGQDDGPIPEPAARSTISSKARPMMVGRSTHSLAQARAALAEGADYIGFGPLFPTPTKLGRPAIGLEEIATMQQEIGQKIPAFCIGGVNSSTLREILAAGATRVVVVSSLLQAENVETATRHFSSALHATSDPRVAK